MFVIVFISLFLSPKNYPGDLKVVLTPWDNYNNTTPPYPFGFDPVTVKSLSYCCALSLSTVCLW